MGGAAKRERGAGRFAGFQGERAAKARRGGRLGPGWRRANLTSFAGRGARRGPLRTRLSDRAGRAQGTRASSLRTKHAVHTLALAPACLPTLLFGGKQRNRERHRATARPKPGRMLPRSHWLGCRMVGRLGSSWKGRPAGAWPPSAHRNNGVPPIPVASQPWLPPAPLLPPFPGSDELNATAHQAGAGSRSEVDLRGGD